MNMIDHFDSGQFARLVKGRRLTTREQDLLSIVDNINWSTYSFNLSNSWHRVNDAGLAANVHQTWLLQFHSAQQTR